MTGYPMELIIIICAMVALMAEVAFLYCVQYM